jgi:hypothetical protein
MSGWRFLGQESVAAGHLSGLLGLSLENEVDRADKRQDPKRRSVTSMDRIETLFYVK